MNEPQRVDTQITAGSAIIVQIRSQGSAEAAVAWKGCASECILMTRLCDYHEDLVAAVRKNNT